MRRWRSVVRRWSSRVAVEVGSEALEVSRKRLEIATEALEISNEAVEVGSDVLSPDDEARTHRKRLQGHLPLEPLVFCVGYGRNLIFWNALPAWFFPSSSMTATPKT